MSYKEDLESITRDDSLGLRKVVSEIGERADAEIAKLKSDINELATLINRVLKKDFEEIDKLWEKLELYKEQ